TLDPEHSVIWVAKNGIEAVALCEKATPQLVLMDLLMPEMDGVEATRRIMAKTPCPILIVTVSVAANASRAFDALGHGAIDAVDRRVFVGRHIRGAATPLLTKIDTIGKMVTKGGCPTPARGRQSAAATLVAIGASAGGPPALASVLRKLPEDFRAGIVVVQH